MLRVIALAIVLVLAPAAWAQPSAPASADGPPEQFFRLLQVGQVAKAYETVGRGTLMEQKKAELQNIANQTASMFQIYGKLVDWELMSEDKWSSSYVLRTYLVRAERGPVFFKMHLYRSPEGWVIGNIYFTDIPATLATH